MAEGGRNVVWCQEQDLDLVRRHQQRGPLTHHGRLGEETLQKSGIRFWVSGQGFRG